MRRPYSVVAALIALAMFLPLGASAATVRPLTFGLSGADVTALQQQLISRGYLSASATGYFGPATLAAVKKFQCGNGIICSGAAYGTVGPATRAALALSALEVIGWIPYWRAAAGTADILPHLPSFTAIMPFGYIVQNDGTLHDAFGLDAPMSTTSATLVAAARAAKVKVIPTVMWSNGAAIHTILSNQASRVALEDRIVALVTTNGFDGINIDFEGKRAETKEYFSLFLKGLYQRVGQKLVYCSIETRIPLADRYGDTPPPPEAGQYANDYVEINKYCDRVQLMTYDQQTVDARLNKAGSEAAGPYIPVSDPAWIKKVVNLTAQTIPKKKLQIGIATYGFRFDMQWAFNPRYATALAAAIGATPSRNVAGELSFIYNPSAVSAATKAAASVGNTLSTTSGTGLATPTTTYSGNATIPGTDGSYHILWWSDAKAIADKVALAKSLGVRGVAIFK